MLMFRKVFLTLVLIALSAAGIFAQGSSLSPGNLSKAEVDAMVAKFTANESSFREALTNYVFNRYATINTIGLGGQITGTYRRD